MIDKYVPSCSWHTIWFCFGDALVTPLVFFGPLDYDNGHSASDFSIYLCDEEDSIQWINSIPAHSSVPFTAHFYELVQRCLRLWLQGDCLYLLRGPADSQRRDMSRGMRMQNG